MCGIVGIICKKSYGFTGNDSDLLETLLLLDYVRGKHSTGVFGVHGNNQVSVAKIASHPLDLFACTEWGSFRTKMSRSMHMVIGHNRRATGGKITSENAHPFVENNIVLVHNGVINSGVKSENKEVEVDSHMVCEAFASSHYEEVVKKIQGAFAFVWYDTKTRTLHTLRNDERPLNIIETEDFYFLASEAWMVSGLLGREGQVKYKVKDIISTEVGQLYSFQKNQPYTKVAVELAKEITYESYEIGGRRGQWVQQGSRVHPLTVPGRAVPKLLTTTSGQQESLLGGETAGVIQFPTNQNREEFYRSLHEPPTGLLAPMVGQEVIFMLTSVRSTSTKLHRVNGTVVSSQHAKTDVSFTTDDAEMFADSKDTMFQGRIKAITWLVGGPTIELVNVQQVIYIDLHHSRIPLIEWRGITHRCKCKECESAIYDVDSDVTKIRWNKEKNRWDATCPRCIAKKIESKEVREQFMAKAGLDEGSLDSVQDGQPECDVAIDAATGAVTTSGEAAPQLH